MILQNMCCLFLFNNINKNGTFVVPAHFFAPVFIFDSWYDKVQPLAYVIGGSKRVRNAA